MPSMTDQNRVNSLMQALFTASGATTITVGAGGGTNFQTTPPFHLRLLTAQGSNTANGTEATSANCPGYIPLSVASNSLGATFCAAPSGGTQSNSNAVTWSATGTWTTVTAIEVWDAAGTPLRWLQGSLTSAITGVVNGDTVQFAAASITLNASTW